MGYIEAKRLFEISKEEIERLKDISQRKQAHIRALEDKLIKYKYKYTAKRRELTTEKRKVKLLKEQVDELLKVPKDGEEIPFDEDFTNEAKFYEGIDITRGI